MARYYDVDYEHGAQRGRYEGERSRYEGDRGRYEGDRGRYEGARGFFRRAEDEVRSWLGDEDAERRRGRDEYEAERRERQGEYWRPSHSANDMRASDLMSRNIQTVYPDDRVGYAARLMRDWDCGALPVVDRENRLVGIVTDRDITTRLIANDSDTQNTVVADCMTERAFACHADDHLRECMRQMARHRVRRLPVVNNRDQVIGVISQGDLARHAGAYTGSGARREIADVLSEISEPKRASRREGRRW